ncbi:MAG: phosphoribosylanthranilate isomerase [Chloroflexi bacterium]|jgi:phosphoribosylanthranilate isomerase|nr:phosphoribosylanthranilate isomerase [Chloroflexota bacterium]MBT7081141.1 phosphoribosylanthranilate isomerase [Chloroflexota bacterium]MBT7289289.1 phosphoribosylanthranilate isomerase [Chloroflexota bacterium]
MTKVKICGIQEKGHAIAAVEAGADLIGMVFAKSRRQVTPEQAKQIVEAVRQTSDTVKTVGVFVNTLAYEVNRIARDCNLDMVQLSGDESWEYCEDIQKTIIKAIHMKNQTDKEMTVSIVAGTDVLTDNLYIVLLDTHIEGQYGGTGKTFDWELARSISARYPIFVAGGLDPNNVQEAIKTMKPLGVDVSSGVETDGVKDVAKIRKFISEAKK